jgi:uncharacterized membrane protein YeaQ/YmgE (transglycosylase-associated protein family)
VELIVEPALLFAAGVVCAHLIAAVLPRLSLGWTSNALAGVIGAGTGGQILSAVADGLSVSAAMEGQQRLVLLVCGAVGGALALPVLATLRRLSDR